MTHIFLMGQYSTMVVSAWTDSIEKTLDVMRQNTMKLGTLSKEKYNALKNRIQYLQLPLAVLSAFNAYAVVGLDNYISENTVTIGSCVVSASIAAYLGYDWLSGSQKEMEKELSFSKDCEAISEHIKQVLTTKREERTIEGDVFLREKFDSYKQIVQGHPLIEKFMGHVTLYKDSICEQVEDMESFVVDHWNILYRSTLRRFKKKNEELINTVAKAGQTVSDIIEPVKDEVVEKTEPVVNWVSKRLSGIWSATEEKAAVETLEENIEMGEAAPASSPKKEEPSINITEIYKMKDIPSMLSPKRVGMAFSTKQ